MAAELAHDSKVNQSYKHFNLGSVGLRSDGAIVTAVNGRTPRPNRAVHAEYRLCNKLDHGAIVFVARVKNDNGRYVMGNARPCWKCQNKLRSRRVAKVYFSKDNNNFGVYYPLEDRFYE